MSSLQEEEEMGPVTPAMKRFLSAERYAVIGKVLSDRSRWDNKVRRLYLIIFRCNKLNMVPGPPMVSSQCYDTSQSNSQCCNERYQTHKYPVIPVRPDNPSSEAIEGLDILTNPVSDDTQVFPDTHASMCLPSLPSLPSHPHLSPSSSTPLSHSVFFRISSPIHHRRPTVCGSSQGLMMRVSGSG